MMKLIQQTLNFLIVIIAIQSVPTTWIIIQITRVSPELRKESFRLATMASIFLLLDLSLFTALPFVGISYGSILLPLAGWFGLRYILYLTWVISWGTKNKKTKYNTITSQFFLALNVALVFLLVYSFYFEPLNLQVTEIYIHTQMDDLPGGQLRAVQVSDLHIARAGYLEEKVIEKVNSLDPDIIFLTGDYLNLSNREDSVSIRDTHEVLSQFHAPYGVYAINGSMYKPARLATLFEGLDITLLDDSVHELSLAAARSA